MSSIKRNDAGVGAIPLAAARFFVIALVMTGVVGCGAPKLVQSAGETGPGVFQALEEAAPVESVTDDGTMLRGVIVPANDASLVVLHLLPSTVSTTTGVSVGVGRTGLAPTLKTFAESGFTSVVFDYRGLGASDEPRRSDRLAEDAKAMWRRAVELARGREDRVVIRAGSLGTLLAAELLAAGVRPAGAVLFAPIRSETIGANASRSLYGPFFGAIASIFTTRPLESDLPDVLEARGVPMLIVLPSEDAYLPPKERELIAAKALEAGAHVERFDGSHQALILRSWGFTLDVDGETLSGRSTPALLPVEREFLESLPHDENLQ